MSDRSITLLLRGLILAGALGVMSGWMALAITDQPIGDLASLLTVISALAFSFGGVAWLAARPEPRNPIAWILAGFVVALGAYSAGRAVMAAIAPNVMLPLDNETQVPADLPSAVAWLEGWTDAIASAATTALLTFGLLLFPNGRLPSRRWRPVAFVLVLGILLVSASNILDWHPDSTIAPFAPDGPGHHFAIGNIFMLFGPLISLVGLIMRYRHSNPTIRSQVKWITWGAVVLVPLFFISSITVLPLLSLIGGLTFVAAYGIAIVRHRLFDIDVVISKTLVFGSLAVFIGGVYVAVVVGVGSLFGSGDEPNAVLSVGATALVAVAFQPVRRRMERVANRVVFGRRATPYEVLSEFSRRVAATSDSLLDDAARSLAEGTRAERVAISIIVDNEPIVAASWPVEPHEGSAEPVSFPIADDDLTLGSLDVYLAAGQELRQDDQRLAEQLASGMGLALRNQLLTERLEVRVEELRESRRRLVAVQDETRRRLERDLHDGAQQQLVALKIKLGLGTGIAHQDGATQTAALLEQLSSEAEQTVDAMRDFARGVYPPLLEAEGLTAAIAAQARRIPLSVTVESDGIGRYPREIEATTYFCVQEAVRNIVQHANATHATVALNQSNGALEFHITDNGVGFDPTTTHGMGLVTMTDRLDAITGHLTIHTQPNTGTTIAGTIPIPIPTETPHPT